jgi:hypothetical protein
MADNNKKDENNSNDEYYFGGITEFSLEDIESEVLNDSVYLDVFAGSDVRYKDEVAPLEAGLDSILKIDAYKYFYKTEEFPEMNFSSEKQVGFLAQEIEKVLPEVVRTNDKGFKSVNYAQVTPLLLQGIKDLNSVVEQQSDVIETLAKKVLELEKNIYTTKNNKDQV